MATEDPGTKSPTEETTAVEQMRGGRCFRPDVDILEEDDELLVMADIPGAKPDKIDIEFEDGQLTIHAEVAPRQEEKTEYLLSEYDVGSYHRSFQISEAVASEKISAEYTEGVLTLHLPKSESSKRRKINVHS
jgi:HSP20 family molecular chaperone IbpA